MYNSPQVPDGAWATQNNSDRIWLGFGLANLLLEPGQLMKHDKLSQD
jgi:hypothetical protein